MDKETVYSYDIFDTLLARDVASPTEIFSIIETEFPYPNFFDIRIRAQHLSDQTFDNIYEIFQKITNERTPIIDKLKEFEIQTEMNHTIPIMTILTEMASNSHPNILISDMYLNVEQITRLLLFHNITQFTKIHVSPQGKHTGEMYKTLLQQYNILSHTGDNYHSDVHMATQYNIKAYHTSLHTFTYLEKYFLKTNSLHSTCLRKLRLSNPHRLGTIQYNLYHEQAIYNIPLLLFMCKKLEEILISENRTKVLFISRDGCLIIKLFSFLYPQFESVYFHSSRIVNNQYTSSYINYIKSIYDKNTCLFFDLHGSFQSGKHMWMNEFGHLPRIFIFDYTGNIHNIPSHVTTITNVGDKIEKMNQDLVGTLCNYKNGKDIRIPLEHKRELIEIQHDALNLFLNIKHLHESILNNTSYSRSAFWKYYYSEIVSKTPDILYHHDNKGHTLTSIANILKTDKGSSYACSHYYTLEYEKIIHDIVSSFPYTKIEILEIGLNRDCKHLIPSLTMWNTYFNNNISLTGFDIVPDFLEFNNDNIRIFIGDQKLPHDLKQVQDRKYHMIVDDGFHASQHQQVSFQTLWKNVEDGGYYVIEDLHWQPPAFVENTMKTLILFQNWINKNYITTPFLSDIQNIVETIASIYICNNDKLLVIKKK